MICQDLTSCDLERVLAIHWRFAYVRKIVIDGYSLDAPSDSIHNARLAHDAFDPNYVDGGWSLAQGQKFNTGSRKLCQPYRGGATLTWEEREDREDREIAWRPLAQLVSLLSTLGDVKRGQRAHTGGAFWRVCARKARDASFICTRSTSTVFAHSRLSRLGLTQTKFSSSHHPTCTA